MDDASSLAHLKKHLLHDSALRTSGLGKLLDRLRLVGGDEKAKEKVLEDVSLDGIVKHIQSLQASNDGEGRMRWQCTDVILRNEQVARCWS